MPAERQGTLAGAVLALVAAGIGLATSFGVHITPEQHDAILTFCGAVAVVAPLVGALFDHSNKQVAARQAAATVIATGEPSPQAKQAAEIQARIDELQAQKVRLGGGAGGGS